MTTKYFYVTGTNGCISYFINKHKISGIIYTELLSKVVNDKKYKRISTFSTHSETLTSKVWTRETIYSNETTTIR